MKKINPGNFYGGFGEFGENPRTDWHLILTASVLCLIAMTILNIFLYGRLSSDDQNQTIKSDPSVKMPNSAELDEIVKTLKQRELDWQNIPEIVLTDPAL